MSFHWVSWIPFCLKWLLKKKLKHLMGSHIAFENDNVQHRRAVLGPWDGICYLKFCNKSKIIKCMTQIIVACCRECVWVWRMYIFNFFTNGKVVCGILRTHMCEWSFRDLLFFLLSFSRTHFTWWFTLILFNHIRPRKIQRTYKKKNLQIFFNPWLSFKS